MEVTSSAMYLSVRWIQKHPLLYMASWMISKVWVVDEVRHVCIFVVAIFVLAFHFEYKIRTSSV